MKRLDQTPLIPARRRRAQNVCAHLQRAILKLNVAIQRFHLWIPSTRSSAAPFANELMPSTYTSLHCHIIFSTKERIRWITLDWRERLHAYLGGTARGLGAVPLAIGGV